MILVKLLCMIFVCSFGITLLIGNFMNLFLKTEESPSYIFMASSWFLFISGFVWVIKNI